MIVWATDPDRNDPVINVWGILVPGLAVIVYLVAAALPSTRRDLRIATGAGVVHRRITAVSAPSAGVERLHLDGDVGGAIAPGDCTDVSWLWLARQAADVDTLSYWRGDVADVAFAFEGFNHDL